MAIVCCRAVELDPLNAAAHSALGLVAEARESYAEACREFDLAVHLASSASGNARFMHPFVPVT